MKTYLQLLVVALAIALPGQLALGQSQPPQVYKIDLVPPPHPEFRQRMGGWPSEISHRTFYAATGTLTIYAHTDGRTDLVFDMEGLLPFGVYTFWDVVSPNFDEFADRPLMNIPAGIDPSKDHWWNDIEFDPNGGPNGFGYGFMADHHGRTHAVVRLDHRPGQEFLLDYHADEHVRGGIKGKDVFPGVLWANVPEWEEPS